MKMTCWKCGKTLEQGQCKLCDPDLSTLKNTINSALKRADRIDEGLRSFKEKIKEWRKSNPKPIKEGLAEDRDINRCIHYLCLMADELEEKITAQVVINKADVKELEQKALHIAELAKKLATES